MSRRVGRYTKYETTELLRMYNQGYSVYKICKELKRTQKSIRNNLIRLGKIEGQITPIRQINTNKTITTEKSLNKGLLYYIMNGIILVSLTTLFVVHPQYNILELILVYIYL
jgi:membrane carboxypeptidase/penicillin-binding protein